MAHIFQDVTMTECAHIFPLSINGTIRVPGNDDKMGEVDHRILILQFSRARCCGNVLGDYEIV